MRGDPDPDPLLGSPSQVDPPVRSTFFHLGLNEQAEHCFLVPSQCFSEPLRMFGALCDSAASSQTNLQRIRRLR